MRVLLIILMLIPWFARAQKEAEKDTLWTSKGNISLNFSQVSLSNWAAGGKSSMSGVGMANYKTTYEKGKVSWESTFDLRHGFLKEEQEHWRKTDDMIDMSSKFGYLAKESSKWNYAGLLNFKSQFAKGINYDDEKEKVISKFMSPGYLNFGLGMDYKNNNLSVLIAAANGKFTFVTDDDLSNQGAFGVDPGKTVRSELGAMVKVEYTKEIMKNVSFDTKIDMFTNYLNDFGNIDIDWTGKVNMKVNDYLSANLVMQFIYDDDIDIEDPDTGKIGPKVQLMESFGAGLTLSF